MEKIAKKRTKEEGKRMENRGEEESRIHKLRAEHISKDLSSSLSGRKR